MPLARALPALAVLLALAASLAPASAQVRFEDAFPGLPDFDRPVDLQLEPGTGRWFVVEQPGVITSFPNDAAVTERDTVLDLRAVVNTEPSWEEGLLGLAFHPDYAQNGYVYVHYTAYPASEGGPHRTIIARFTVTGDPPTIDPASELVLLDIEQPFRWHNGGQLAFHPLDDEAYLYLSLGDGGSGGDPGEHGQDRTTLLGSILRLDVDNPAPGLNYGIPPNNPFVGNGEGWREEIWAWGLRNPWRFSIDPGTGDLWVGDVGQNQWEEVTRVTEPGSNLGWDVKEAVFCFEAPDPGEPPCHWPTLLDPIWWYEHVDGNNSVTGGHVYRGTAIPELAGTYVYGDFISGRVWSLDFEGLETPENTLLGQLTTVAAFGVDEAGELYVASFVSLSTFLGRIYRVVPHTVSAEPPPREAPSLRLAGPNPFRARTALALRADTPGPARVAVYDVLGREVAVLFDGVVGAEEVRVALGDEGLAPGVYVVRLRGPEGGASLRVTRLR